MKKPDILTALESVVKAFDKLKISYYIAGSIASSAYGIARSTMDIDLVSDLKPAVVSPLVELLKNDFYIDEEMILDAIGRKSSFNIIHLETMFKIDIFVSENTPYSREVFRRIRKDTLEEAAGACEYLIASPEDIVLSKLKRFRMGGEISDSQWNDIVGVLKVQRDLLDEDYLEKHASELGLTDLLKKAFEKAGLHK